MSDFLMTYYSLLNLKSYSFFLQTIVMTITLFLFPKQFNCYEDNNQLTPNNVLSFTLTPLANVCLFSLVTVVCEPFMSHHKTFWCPLHLDVSTRDKMGRFRSQCFLLFRVDSLLGKISILILIFIDNYFPIRKRWIIIFFEIMFSNDDYYRPVLMTSSWGLSCASTDENISLFSCCVIRFIPWWILFGRLSSPWRLSCASTEE